MSEKLYQLGLFAFKRRWIVVAGWLTIAVVIGILAVTFNKPATSSFTIPGTEAQTALDELARISPNASGASGRIVFAAPEGKSIIEYKSAIEQTLSKVGAIGDIQSYSPFVVGSISKDQKFAFAQIQTEQKADAIDETTHSAIVAALSPAREAGLRAEVGGTIIDSTVPGQILGVGEIAGVLVALLVLVMTFASIVAAGMPLITALSTVSIGMLSIFALSQLLEINSTTPVLAIMLGLAVGIDYALFIVTRHRKYLVEGLTLEQSTAKAISTAGNAVIFAALTVVIALSALTVVGIPFLASMGLAAALTVAIAGVIAVTLTPALLSFAGLKILSKRQRKLRAAHKPDHTPAAVRKTFAHRWVQAITKRPALFILGAVALLGTMAIPMASLQLGFPSEGNESTDTTQRRAYDLVTEGFGPGFNGPLIVLASMPDGITPQQIPQEVGKLTAALSQFDNVITAQPAGLSKDGKTAIFQVIPKTGPVDQATKTLITDIRTDKNNIVGDTVKLSVTGSTALSADVDRKLAAAMPLYVAVVIGLSLILLIVVFRSILIPLKATIGFLLTLGATFGAVVVLFQWEWLGIFDYSPIIGFLPILIIGILFGLAMDYEFFLVSGMQEAYQHDGKNPKQAVIEGFTYGSKVVTAAAAIMIFIFAGFVMSHEPIIRIIGFALAFGVFVDAFIVRMTIVPAVMAIAGKSAWWIPKWLDRILPHVSIEGKD